MLVTQLMSALMKNTVGMFVYSTEYVRAILLTFICV